MMPKYLASHLEDMKSDLSARLGEGMSSAVVNAAAGDTTVVSAVAGKIIRVHQLALKAAEDATVRFESGTGGTALTGIMQIYCVPTTLLSSVAADGGLILPFSPMGWFWTAAGVLLNLEVTGGDVDGVLGYSLVTT